MVSIYKISNSEKDTTIEINEMLLLDLIFIIEKRNPSIKNKLINIWETLEDRKFNEKQLNR